MDQLMKIAKKFIHKEADSICLGENPESFAALLREISQREGV